MSWTLASRIAKKKVGTILGRSTQSSGDIHWPWDTRIGQSLRLDPTPFILAGWDMPAADLTVVGLGYCQWETDVYRIHLEGEERGCLTVYQGNIPEEREVVYFRLYDELFPKAEEEFAEWLDADEGHIGMTPFYTPDDEEFLRLYDDNQVEKVEPFQVREKRFKAQGMELFDSYDLQWMVYGRAYESPHNSNQQEQLWVGCEESADAISIKIYRGLPILDASVTLL